MLTCPSDLYRSILQKQDPAAAHIPWLQQHIEGESLPSSRKLGPRTCEAHQAQSRLQVHQATVCVSILIPAIRHTG